ncbi:FAD-dependent oxidoreductase [Streptomyces sp. NPDC044571]|uniref:FAD-dependent oxidoreductase n=1 Tax=Streptomyces sp. NPDC044571 TaxID=3155371 RepID=UPI0033D1B6CA
MSDQVGRPWRTPMQILALTALSDYPAEQSADGQVVFRPDLQAADDDALAAALRRLRPRVILTDRELSMPVLRAWHAACDGVPGAVVRLRRGPSRSGVGAGLPTMLPEPGQRLAPLDVTLFTAVRTADREAGMYRALAVAERFLQEQAKEELPPVRPTRPAGAPSVLLVGAGVVNLVTARTLLAHGYRVTVVDAAPDPRLRRPWQEYGCSRGGGNARMFTYTEMDDYHSKSAADTESNLVFDRPPGQLGWDIRPDPDNPDGDQSWVREFKRVPAWLARAYNGDILGLNRRAGELWNVWRRSAPELFEGSHLREDILRLYQDPDQLVAANRRQRGVGALLAAFGADEVRERFPGLAEAEGGIFAGGLLVRGFTVNVHDFMARLLGGLEAAGAVLRFGLRAERVLRDGTGGGGQVTGVLTADGPLVHDHYVLSPGVGGTGLLAGGRLAGRIHGVVGCWATLPNVEPELGHSLKVARRGHVAEDANVTVGRDAAGRPALMIGSGYGWTGADPHNIDEQKLDAIHTAVADTARRLFPRAFEQAGGEEGLRATRKHCVRPWTASNLGLFDVERAERGAFVMTGGHNTGGFAQAPVVAEAVLYALGGRHHPMHTLYHPLRTERFLGAVGGPGSGTRIAADRPGALA